MTPSNPSPDTGAGTPLTAEDLPFPTTDASKWAAEFVRLHGGDEALMLSWFANAIEHGRGPDVARLSVADGPGPEERPLSDRIDDIARSITALFNAAGQGQPAHSRALENALAACRAALPVEETGRS